MTCVCLSMLSLYFLHITGGSSGAPRKTYQCMQYFRRDESGKLVDEVALRQRKMANVKKMKGQSRDPAQQGRRGKAPRVNYKDMDSVDYVT